MIAVNSPASRRDADVVERDDGGVALAVDLAARSRPAAAVAAWTVVVVVVMASPVRVGPAPARAARPRRRAAAHATHGAGRPTRRPGRRCRGAIVRPAPPQGSGEPLLQAPDRSRLRTCGLWRGTGRRTAAAGRGWSCWSGWPSSSSGSTSVVVGGGALIGRTDSPSLALSVLATAVVALGFEPVQSALEACAGRLVYGGLPTPYDVLSRFSETVTGGYATEELPARMAMLLAEGTGAEWAQVWLVVDRRRWRLPGPRTPPPTVAAVPAAGARDTTAEGRRALTVRQGGELLGVLRLQERPGLPLTSIEERLFIGLAAQAGLVLRRSPLRAELEARHEELVDRADELAGVAGTAHRDPGRRAATSGARHPRRRAAAPGGAGGQPAAGRDGGRPLTGTRRPPARRAGRRRSRRDRDALQLSRGIYPRLLSDEGLVPALRAAVATSPIPVTVEADGDRRLPAPVEAALYFCCLEAVQNAAKHSGAGAVTVRLAEDRGLAAHRHRRRRRLRPGAGPRRRGRFGAGQHARQAGCRGRHGHRRLAPGQRYDGDRRGPASAAFACAAAHPGPPPGGVTCAPGSPGPRSPSRRRRSWTPRSRRRTARC